MRLISDIRRIFRSKLTPAFNDAREVTLETLWTEKRQVIVFYHCIKGGMPCSETPSTLCPEFLWPGRMIPSPWPRATRVKDLIDFLESASSSSYNWNPKTFHVHQGVLTPTVYTILRHVTSSLRDHFARPACKAVVDWLDRRTASPTNGSTCLSEINVVMVDYVDLEPAFVHTVVNLNDRKRGLVDEVIDESVFLQSSPADLLKTGSPGPLSSRALTPTPLQFIDDKKSPSVTPSKQCTH